MTGSRDPWEVAAETINEGRARQEEADRLSRQAGQANQAQENRLALAREQLLKSAINDAARYLEVFLRERGAAAIKLLGAARATIVFGSDSDGDYAVVYLSGEGFLYESGFSSNVGTPPTEKRTASAWEAANYFARYGDGRRNPELVRAIVAWLTRQVESRRPR